MAGPQTANNVVPAGITFDAPLQEATTVPASVVFDNPTTAPTTVSLGLDQGEPATAPQAVSKATVSAIPAPKGTLDRISRWADNVASDVKYGTDLTGIGSVLKAMGAHGVYNGNSEAVGDFMASLPLGLLKGVKGAAEAPQSGQHWQGVKDTVGGALQAATIPAALASPQESELAAAGTGKAADAIASQASRAANAVRSLPGKLRVDSVQPELQQGVRNVLSTVAKDEGVTVPQSASIRDVAAQLATAVRAKASGLYKQLDAATGGGRFQRFDEQLQNIQRAIRDVTGIDPDREGALVERLNTVQDAKDAALEEAKANGVNPKLIDQANATWKRAAALDDLSRHLRLSTSGMRPDIAAAKASPEVLSTARLFPRMNGMYNSGRLQQALGESNAQDLLQAVDAAHLRVQKLRALQKTLKTAGKLAAYGSGLGWGGYEAGRHFLAGSE